MRPLLPLTFALSLAAAPALAQTVTPLPNAAEAADVETLEADAPDAVVIVMETEEDDAANESNVVPADEVTCLDGQILDRTGSCVAAD